MDFLAIIVVDNLTGSLFFILSNGICVSCIDSCNWGRFWVFALVLLLSQIFLLPFFTSFFGDIYAFGIVGWVYSLELSIGLILVILRVLYLTPFGLHLNYCGVGRTVFLLTSMIHFLAIKDWWRIILASAATTFSTICFEISSSRLCCSVLAWIKR